MVLLSQCCTICFPTCTCFQAPSNPLQLAFADGEHRLGGPATLMEVLSAGPQQLSLPFQSASGTVTATDSGGGNNGAAAIAVDGTSTMGRDLAAFLQRPVGAVVADVAGVAAEAASTVGGEAAVESFTLPPFESMLAELEAGGGEGQEWGG